MRPAQRSTLAVRSVFRTTHPAGDARRNAHNFEVLGVPAIGVLKSKSNVRGPTYGDHTMKASWIVAGALCLLLAVIAFVTSAAPPQAAKGPANPSAPAAPAQTAPAKSAPAQAAPAKSAPAGAPAPGAPQP